MERGGPPGAILPAHLPYAPTHERIVRVQKKGKKRMKVKAADVGEKREIEVPFRAKGKKGLSSDVRTGGRL